jgi:hypothetical protein
VPYGPRVASPANIFVGPSFFWVLWSYNKWAVSAHFSGWLLNLEDKINRAGLQFSFMPHSFRPSNVLFWPGQVGLWRLRCTRECLVTCSLHPDIEMKEFATSSQQRSTALPGLAALRRHVSTPAATCRRPELPPIHANTQQGFWARRIARTSLSVLLSRLTHPFTGTDRVLS